MEENTYKLQWIDAEGFHFVYYNQYNVILTLARALQMVGPAIKNIELWDVGGKRAVQIL